MNRRAEGLSEVNADADGQVEQKAASKKSVYIYIATLFFVVIFFIVLSYLINDRNNSQIHTLNEKNVTAQQHVENLQSDNLQLHSENDAYEMKITEIEQQLAALKIELRETRKNWRDDVQAVLTYDREQYNALLSQYNVLKENYDIKVDSDD